MSTRKLHALCPVDRYVASAWAGWTVVGVELVEHTAGVAARVADSRTNRAWPELAISSGKPYQAYYLVRNA